MNIPISEKYSLTIIEATAYFSIGNKCMRRLAEDNLGTFSVYNGNRFLIIREAFEEYLRTHPMIRQVNEDEVDRARLQEKEVFNPEEVCIFYGLSRKKFRRFLETSVDLPFTAFFKTRKIIIRSEFEKYMGENPEIWEGLKSGRSSIS